MHHFTNIEMYTAVTDSAERFDASIKGGVLRTVFSKIKEQIGYVSQIWSILNSLEISASSAFAYKDIFMIDVNFH